MLCPQWLVMHEARHPRFLRGRRHVGAAGPVHVAAGYGEVVMGIRNDRSIPVEWLLFRFSYDPETGLLTHRVGAKKGRPCGWPNGNGYIRIHIAGVKTYAHRVIMAMVDGVWPDVVDHVNGDRSDNRRENLRSCTSDENRCNTRGRSGRSYAPMKGVSIQRGGKYKARIYHGGREIYLGRFSNPDDAEAAVRAAAIKHHGEFAKW